MLETTVVNKPAVNKGNFKELSTKSNIGIISIVIPVKMKIASVKPTLKHLQVSPRVNFLDDDRFELLEVEFSFCDSISSSNSTPQQPQLKQLFPRWPSIFCVTVILFWILLI